MESRRRVNVFKSGGSREGKLLFVPETFEDLLQEASTKLSVAADSLYTEQGARLDDVDLIRDNEVLYISETGSFPGIPDCHRLHPARVTSHSHFVDDIPSQGSMAAIHLQPATHDTWITLNVGGKYFTTTRSTLVTKEQGSMLSRMFSQTVDGSCWSSSVDHSGAYLIDRSPRYFEPILNYLRHGQIVIDKNVNLQGVLEEARFFGMTSLVEELNILLEKDIPPNDQTPMTRRELSLAILSTPVSTELRCQGLNFSSANLSKLDLRQINFKYANFTNVNLSGANLANCNFERADLSHANLDGANLLGVKMLCAHLEGTSLVGCNFEDPAGSRANMEGANMKNVNLEGSHMAGVNLRVATLKNSNLQNCDLRGAVLAGADLENCDLSGCDLQEANLRGANLKGAMFELMLNPLHMSQTVR